MFNESEHPRDNGGKFTEKSASELKQELAQELPERKLEKAVRTYRFFER